MMSNQNLPVPDDMTTVPMTDFCASGPPAGTPQPVLSGELAFNDHPPALKGTWELPAGALMKLGGIFAIVELQAGTVTVFVCEQPLVFDTERNDGHYFEVDAGLGVQLVAESNPEFLLALGESGGTVSILADADSELNIWVVHHPPTQVVCGTDVCWGFEGRVQESDGGIDVCILNKCWSR